MRKLDKMERCLQFLDSLNHTSFVNIKTHERIDIVGYNYDTRNPTTSCKIIHQMGEISLFEFVDNFKPLVRSYALV